MDWFFTNIEWIFSGIGVFILSIFFIKNKNKQIQKSGDNSTNIQVGGNADIKIDNDK